MLRRVVRVWALWRSNPDLLSHLQAGLVRVLAADPKLLELAYGRAIFDIYGAKERP